jgi:DNA-binding PadR family transcriptional regulator
MQISEPAEYIILGLLHDQPMHGYEMFQQFESGTLGEIVHLEMSQMYAFLKKLEQLGYIEAELESQGARPPRKIFHLTTTGRAFLLQWLTIPVDKPRDIRMLFLIKLYFVRRLLPGGTVALIEAQKGACRQFLVHLEARREQHRQQQDDGTFFDHVVLSSRIHQTRALLTWLDELLAEVANT